MSLGKKMLRKPRAKIIITHEDEEDDSLKVEFKKRSEVKSKVSSSRSVVKINLDEGTNQEEEAGFEIKRSTLRKKNVTSSGSVTPETKEYSKEYLLELQSANRRTLKEEAVENAAPDNDKVDQSVHKDSNDSEHENESENDFISLAQDEKFIPIEQSDEEEFVNELDIDEGRGFEDELLPIGAENRRDHDVRRRQEMQQAIEDISDAESDDWMRGQARMAGAALDTPVRPTLTPEILPLPDLASVLYNLKENYAKKDRLKTQLLDDLEILRKDIEAIDVRMEQVQQGLNEASQKYDQAESRLQTCETSVD